MKLLFNLIIIFFFTSFYSPASLKANSISKHEIDLTCFNINKSINIQGDSITEKDPVTALVLCIFLGPLGIHRLYLGTSVTTMIAYVFTGGGGGLVWIADFVLLANAVFTKDLTKYSNNKSFFMWIK